MAKMIGINGREGNVISLSITAPAENVFSQTVNNLFLIFYAGRFLFIINIFLLRMGLVYVLL